MRRVLAFAATALTFCAAQAQAQQPLAFVTCPILRDTATVPCWLAEHEGELYYLGAQGDFAAGVTAPSLGHQALIEGAPTAARRCGGKVMTDLHISIRPERDRTCDAILPATDAFRAEPPQASGPVNSSSTPGAGMLPPAPGSLSRRFQVLYDFDWQTAGRDTDVLQEAAAYIKANPQGELRVQGYRGSVQLSGGRVLEEVEGIDLRRAQEVIATLQALGIEADIFAVDNPLPELGDYTRRRAVIEIVMSGSDDHSEH